jgi:hypothetical protein
MKGGVCVTTVSIVGGCNDLPDRAPADQIDTMGVVAEVTGRLRRVGRRIC